MTYKRKEIIGDCTLYLGDCLEVMPTLDKVDHGLFDPPYEAITQEKIGGIKRNDGAKVTEKLSFQAIDLIRQDIFDCLVEVCDKWSLIFCTPEGVKMWADVINESVAKYKRACVWIKPDAMPQLNGQGPASSCEMFVASWHGKGKSVWNSGGKRGAYTHLVNPPTRDGRHPTEKPINLIMELLTDFTKEGDTVLDGFMGSGTTGVACAKLGRKFIGIELDENYFNIACERIEKAYSQPDLFVPQPEKLKQETLL